MSNPNDFINFLKTDNHKENGIDESVMQKMHRYWVLAGLRQSKENLQNDQDKKDNNKQEYKRQLRYLRRQIILHYLKNTFLFPIWFIRIISPSFFKGTPNIWTNLKLIFTKKEFHPLRMAMLSWLAFSYLLIQGGVFYFRHAPSAKAATYSWLQTDWSGGVDSGTAATHASNRTGWTQYSAQTNLNTASAGQVKLASGDYFATDGNNLATNGDDTGGDFDSGINSNTALVAGSAGNTWTTLASVPSNVNNTIQTLRNGLDDNIYVVAGAGANNFYNYSVANNTWTTLATIPNTTYYGSQIIRNGSDDTIYLVIGNGTNGFYSYSISGNTWTALTIAPGNINDGSSIYRNGGDDAIYIAAGTGNATAFYSYSIAGNTWTTLTVVPGNVGWGSLINGDPLSNSIYLAIGGNSASFYSYSILNNTWSALASIPFGVTDGSEILRNGTDDTIYIGQGGCGSGFYSYSVANNTWTTLAVHPEGFCSGAKMIRGDSGDTIYTMTGSYSSTGFFSYSIAGNTWTTLAVTPGNVDYGPKMIRSGSDNYIYLFQGGSTTGFYRYRINATKSVALAVASETAGGWGTVGLPDLPGNIYYGAQMMRYLNEDSIYVVQANGNPGFYRYSLSGNTWTSLAVVPSNTGFGAQIIRDGASDTMYLVAGNRDNAFYSYSISGNTWTTLATLPNISEAGPGNVPPAVPRSVEGGAQMIRNSSDDTIYLATGDSSTGFYKYSISGNTWTALAVVPGNLNYGSTMLRNGADNTIYLAQGNFDVGFYSYSISANTWTVLPSVPWYYGDGPQMLRNGSEDRIYLQTGNYDDPSRFYYFSISGNTWTQLASVPVGVGAGSRMMRNASDDTIYLSAGYYDFSDPTNTSDGFYRYSISDNTWTALAVLPAVNNRNDYGSQMIRNGSDDTIYVMTGGNANFFSYSVSGNTWTPRFASTLAAVPSVVGLGAKMIRYGASDTIYIASGAGSNAFFSYSISGNTWTTLSGVPGNVSTGAQMIYDSTNTNIYLVRGGSGTGFYKYSISGSTWTTLSVVPTFVADGAQMIYDSANTNIYLASGNYATGFYKYSISDSTWTALSVVPIPVGAEAQMILNSADNNIYLAPADGNGFYKYSISDSTWTALSVVPNGVYDGAQMIFDSANGNLYFVSGNNAVTFYKYSLSGSTWTTLSNVPTGVGNGAQMIFDSTNNNIYLVPGMNTKNFYKYSISNSTWTVLGTTPTIVSSGGQMIYNSATGNFYLAPGNNTVGFYKYSPGGNTYQTSGTFTSAMIDVGALEFGNISFTSSTVGVGALPVRFQIATNNDNSTWSYVGPDGTGSTYFTNTASTAINVGNDATRYLKYKIYLQTADTSKTPTVSDVTFGYTAYNPSGTLVSSAFDTGSTASSLSALSWTENLNTNGDVKYQIRTASTANGLSSATFVGPDGTAGTYFTDPTGGESMPAAFSAGGNDRFFQYQAILTTTNGVITPVLSDVTANYTINNTPQVSGSGVTATQNANGTVMIVYSTYDSDGTIALGDTDGLATPSFQYSLDNGNNWLPIVSGLTDDIAATATTSRAIGGGWVTSTVIWTPRNEISASVPQAMVSVGINDGELVGSFISATSPAFVLDAKNPVVGSPAIVVIATTTPATLRLSATDDNTMQMAVSLDSGMSGATWGAYSTAGTITLDNDPATVYAQFTDSFFNTSTIQSVTTPGTPSGLIFRDTSNPNTSDYKEFIAWSVVALPTPGFSRYDIYRSTNGTDYTLLTSIANRTTNYYLDQSLSGNTTYYYKVATVDSNGNTSPFSLVVSDNTDGQGGTDTITPTVTNVTTSNITTQGFTVTWDTDEVASSKVAYSAIAFGPTFSTTTVNTMTRSADNNLGQHSVNLSGLTPNTEYFFQVASTDPTGNIGYENNSNSGYSAITLEGPTISNVVYNSVYNTGATITWSSSASADSTVYYSTNANMSGALSVTSENLTTEHSISLTDLSQGTLYYFYVSSGGAVDNNSGNYHFFTTTEDLTAPTISNISASPVADTTAVINWDTDEKAQTQAVYGTTSGLLTNFSILNAGLNLKHTVLFEGLTPDTAYYYVVASVDGSGNTTTSSERMFTTLETLSEEASVLLREQAAIAARTALIGSIGGGGGSFVPNDTVPPVISNVKTSNITSESVTIQWTTDESGESSVRYGTGDKYDHYYFNYDVPGTSHLVTLTNLNPSSKYNFQVSTADKLGNRAYSANQNFSTISGIAEIDAVQGEVQGTGKSQIFVEGTPEYILTSLVEGTAKFIQEMSSGVSLGTLEAGLITQYTTIKELGKLVPLPLISGQPVVEVGGTFVKIFWTTDKPSNSFVGLAPDSTFQNNQEYSQIIGDANALVENHEVLISELKPDTLYHYQVRSKTPVSDTAKSRDFTFKTKPELVEILNYKIEKVSDTEALFSWSTNIPTDSKITHMIYGQDGLVVLDSLKANYDKNVVTEHKLAVKDLEGGQIYQIELAGEDSNGNIVSKTISSFSTSEIDSPPIITQVQTDAALIPGVQTTVQAIISWTTNEPATSQIFFKKGFGGTDGKTEFTQSSPLDPTYVKRHVMVVTDFDPGVVYQFQVESSDASGNITRSKTYTILTPKQRESVFQVIINNMTETFSWVGKLGI